MNITHVVGARPNFMKAAPVMRALASSGVAQTLIHTGQHYDDAMSARLFEQLELPPPDINLNIGSASHTRQTAAIMIGLEASLTNARPDLLVVYGDVNSTLAAALVGSKMGIPIAHVEAGVRSMDRSMPEEINRLVTDRVSRYLLAPSPEASDNLRREGIDEGSIHCVGNVMIDSLIQCLPLAESESVLSLFGLRAGDPYILATLHRASTTDDAPVLERLIRALSVLASRHPIIFPVHPRTRARVDPSWVTSKNLHLVEPVGYLQFLGLLKSTRLMITDSGGVQVESSYLGVPCLTVRDTTEWPETIRLGTNTLVGREAGALVEAAQARLLQPAAPRPSHAIWDGRAAQRIAAVVIGGAVTTPVGC